MSGASFQVLPSMLAVKANNGEIKESSRFKKLAFDELVLNLSKKKMKALIPQAIRAIYIGGLLMLCAGLLVVSRNSVDASNFLSFLTAVALLIEPIQVFLLLVYSCFVYKLLVHVLGKPFLRFSFYVIYLVPCLLVNDILFFFSPF